MPPNLDVYVITRFREAETLDRFVSQYVDWDASDDLEGEELMMLSLGADREPDELTNWDWEPAKSLSHILSHALDHPRRAFTVYLKPKDRVHNRIVMAFTENNQTVLGISIDDASGSPTNLERAKGVLRSLASEFKGYAGFIGCEEPPPLLGDSCSPKNSARFLYSWKDG